MPEAFSEVGPEGKFVPSGAPIGRRQFLRGALALGGGLAVAGMGGKPKHGPPIPAHAKHHHGRRPPPAVSTTKLDSGVEVVTARWLIEENAKPGTNNWVVTGIQTPHAIEGFASQVSAVPGDELTLFVNTTAQSFHVEVYRMGYYQGLAGRLIDTSDTVAGVQQPPSTLTPGVNTVACPWQPSLTLKVTKGWPPGNYLLKLVGDGGQQQYIPLTIRNDASNATYVLQNSVTCWQAYNLWGGYSLYFGKTASGQSFANRARIVSFDRPYPQTWAQGAADFFGNEFPLLYDMEQFGLDLTYWTDVDLHNSPGLLANHKALFSLGHDEYWSSEMRQAAQSALSSGTNLAFLGANACYRQIRLNPSLVGANRLQTCYKDAAEDPFAQSQPSLTTVDWNQAPLNDPESSLIGSMYQSVGANGDLIVTDGSAWFWHGCGLPDGTRLPGVVQGEYDRYVPSLPGPTNADVLAHSPVPGQNNWSDITYYTASGGGGVLATGMASWVFKLSNTTDFPSNIVPAAIPGITEVLRRAMQNVYGTFGAGPASVTKPSGGNWSSIYGGAAALAPTAQGTNAA